MLDNYGCWSCTHFIKERLMDNGEWIGYCEMDADLHKRHFIAFNNEKCQRYLPGICDTIYNFINSHYNGVTKEDIENIYGKFYDLDDLLDILIKQKYISSTIQNGIIYYFS